MTDLEMTKLCAQAMGLKTISGPVSVGGGPFMLGGGWPQVLGKGRAFGTERETCYDPLHDDAQAAALVKHFRIETRVIIDGNWQAMLEYGGRPVYVANSASWNRAIVECVASLRGSL